MGKTIYKGRQTYEISADSDRPIKALSEMVNSKLRDDFSHCASNPFSRISHQAGDHSWLGCGTGARRISKIPHSPRKFLQRGILYSMRPVSRESRSGKKSRNTLNSQQQVCWYCFLPTSGMRQFLLPEKAIGCVFLPLMCCRHSPNSDLCCGSDDGGSGGCIKILAVARFTSSL